MTDKCQQELRVAKAEANKHAAALRSAEQKVNELNTQMDRMCGEAIEVRAWGVKGFPFVSPVVGLGACVVIKVASSLHMSLSLLVLNLSQD